MTPTNSFCNDHQPELKFMSEQTLADEVSDDENVEFEYFQCTPSLPGSHKQRSQFKGVMESLRKFSKSNQRQPIEKSRLKGIPRNNQTFSYQHEVDDEHRIESEQQKSYRSHTKIQNIPNGVRIVTEILKEDNDDEFEDSANCFTRQTQTDWINKKIDVIVEDCNDEN